MTFELIKKIISIGKYEKTDLLNKMDVFLLADRITQEQYQDLRTLMG